MHSHSTFMLDLVLSAVQEQFFFITLVRFLSLPFASSISKLRIVELILSDMYSLSS